MYIGSDDGVYYLPTDSSSATPKQVLRTSCDEIDSIRGYQGNICSNTDRVVPSIGR
ncbi:MAG: hypothetical protein J07HQW2_00151 [Haloquadratum walsbyi J07HQW2]|uniref:Uncharacterized protein n=1 Tax=Haloquadratum walsbyi J07HQW2 TaxID=1238425 RepID=U1NAS6_9EURY|nr:MAG: hypothetical protein J07HQW2_00151 [Haloquadratum walsbyi J07HQW2]